MAIFLCGFMGCGKTTIGKTLSKFMGCSFCDTDELIEKKAGMTIPQIFKEKGEEEFRRLETEVIKNLGSFSGVVSCGGGAMLSEKNAEIAASKGIVIFLVTDFETCYERIKDDSNRPLAVSNTKEQLFEIFCQRMDKYRANSKLAVDAEASPMEVSKNIIKTLKILNFLK